MESWRIYTRLKLSLALYQLPPWSLDAVQLAAFEPRYARQLALEERIADQAGCVGLAVTDQEIGSALASLDLRLGPHRPTSRQMAQLGLAEIALCQALAHEVLMEKMLEQVAAQAPVPAEQEVEAWYQRHLGQFVRPEQRLCSHILLTVDEQQEECQPEAVFRRIHALRRRLLSDSGAFGQLAERHSQCPTALNGGNLGWVGRGVLYDTLENVLFTLTESAISDVVTSPMGLHILYCRSIRTAQPLTRDQALQKVRQRLGTKLGQQFQRKWLQELYARPLNERTG